jgi:hypothetical protein
MKEYEKKLVDAVRRKSARLRVKSDERIIELYNEYSQQHYCAGWLTQSEKGVNAYIEWATTAPCDIKDNP